MSHEQVKRWGGRLAAITAVVLMSSGSSLVTQDARADDSTFRVACWNQYTCWIEGEECGGTVSVDGEEKQCLELVIEPGEG